MLNWLVEEKGIAPHIPVFDKSKREDGTFSRSAFRYDPASDVYLCPADRTLTTTGTLVNDGATLLYLARKHDCDNCELKALCCPKVPFRKVPRHRHEAARDVARSLAGTELFEQSRRARKKIEMRFAHLKRILRLGRLRLRAHEVPGTSSRWPPLPKTCAGSPGWSAGHHRQSISVLPRRCQCHHPPANAAPPQEGRQKKHRFREARKSHRHFIAPTSATKSAKSKNGRPLDRWAPRSGRIRELECELRAAA